MVCLIILNNYLKKSNNTFPVYCLLVPLLSYLGILFLFFFHYNTQKTYNKNDLQKTGIYIHFPAIYMDSLRFLKWRFEFGFKVFFIYLVVHPKAQDSAGRRCQLPPQCVVKRIAHLEVAAPFLHERLDSIERVLRHRLPGGQLLEAVGV